MNKNCPCVGCVSFAICNSILKAMWTPDITTFSQKDRNCKDLRDFLGVDLVSNSTWGDGPEERQFIDDAREVFGLKQIYRFVDPE